MGMKKFSLDYYKGNYAMHCDTKEKAKIFVITCIRWVGHGAMGSLILFLNGFLMKMKLYIVLIMEFIII